MGFSPSTAGVVYRCPLCSQHFGGRHPDVYPKMTEADLTNPAAVRTLTSSVARADPRILEHIATHSPAEWLIKIDTLEREIARLRDGVSGHRKMIHTLTAGNEG